MALTKAQVSLVTVTALGIAPGGYEADLSILSTQKELAEFIANYGLLSAGTNAEFALAIGKNVGLTAGSAVTALFNALESGTSRADAVVDFANSQLVAGNATLTAALAKAEAYTAGSKDLAELKAAVAADVVATPSGLVVEFKDEEKDQHSSEDSDSAVGQNVVNIGKAQIDAGASKVSADFTFTLANQIGAAEKFEGQFLSPLLERQAADKSGSKIVLELRNLREAADSATPLKYLPTNGFGFTIDGQLVQITSTAIDAAETYADLLSAIKARIEELKNGVNLPQDADAAVYAKLATFTVELGQTKSAEERDATGNITKTYDVNVTQILLTDTAGTTLAPVGYSNRDGIIDQSGFTLFAQMSDAEAQTITKLISTNVELTNIGYGSQGATLDIGGQSNSDKGVEEFKITAKNGVWLTTAVSQGAGSNNHLERIELQTGSNSYFRVGTQKNDPNHVVALVDQDFTQGGLVDVQQVEASNAGSVAINSWISDAVLSRYSLKDTGLYTTDDTDALVEYNLTSGNDVLNLAIDTNVLQAVDTKVNVSTGSGNDVVTVMASKGANIAAVEEVASAATWLANQQQNANITIDAGAGNDWIMTTGAGNATIKAGEGNDTVRVDNSGDRAVFVFNHDTTTNINELKSNNNTTSSSGVTPSAQTHNFFKAQVQVTFKGFESAFVAVDYNKTTYTTNNQQINQAIKKAINEDAVLSKLINASDNGANALGVESLIDGALVTGDLSVSIIPPTVYVATETATVKAAREKVGQLLLSDGEDAKAIAAYKVVDTTYAGVVADFTAGASGTVDVAGTVGQFAAVEGQYMTTTAGTVEPVITTTTEGGSGISEVQTIDFAGVTISTAGNIGFESDNATGLAGDVVAAVLTTDSSEAVAAKVAAAFNGDPNVNATVVGTVVTLTFDKTAAAKGIDVTELALDGTLTTALFVAAGAASSAESDNVINLGAGQDVLTLGTGALSNDTVKIEGYNLGEKSIVNFTGTAAAVDGTTGEDLLDFTSYLTNIDSNKARVATTLDATLATSAVGNSVTILNYLSTETIDGTAVISFDALTAANVKDMINDVGGAVTGTLDVDMNTGGAATLTQNHVLMLENAAVINGNAGEYKVFHITSVGNSADAATVQLIGTLDFGADNAGTDVIDVIAANNFA